jgi:integrase
MKPVWRVRVVDYGRDALMLRAVNRDTGKVKSRKAGSGKRKDAQREAGLWEAELNTEGLIESPKWSEAAVAFESYLASRRPGTRARFRTALAAFSRVIGDPRMAALTEAMLAEFVRVYSATVAPATTVTTLRHLRVFVRWAVRQRMSPRVIHFEMPRMGPKAKGRPLTLEEVERGLAKAEAVRPKDAASWRFLILGLWAGGLRIGEAVNLSWDAEAPARVEATGEGRFQIVLEAEAQKGNKKTVSPAAPEFAEMLQGVPQAERRGRVFKLATRRIDNASQTVAQIFKAAGVQGTAHDLRRAFATRWAPHLSAQHLQIAMRHGSIVTTLGYYAQGDLGLESAFYGQKGNKSGNKAPLASLAPIVETPEN